MDRKKHWENIYHEKDFKKVSWFQNSPDISIQFIKELKLNSNARIIDIGAGESHLTEHLIKMGFTNITVLDISELAIEKAKKRLGEKSSLVQWVVSDVVDYSNTNSFDLWHDRATFHFLTNAPETEAYVKNANTSIKNGGYMIVGTFSENGPDTCSGIPIQQYSKEKLNETFSEYFSKIKCINTEHFTPTGKTQEFTFCSFSKMS